MPLLEIDLTDLGIVAVTRHSRMPKTRFRESEDGPWMLDNRYEITDHLGDGAFGEVKVATDTISAKQYAVKMLQVDELLQQRMLINVKKEIMIMRYLHHPHVVRLHESFYEDHILYLIVDLCRGGDIYDLLAPAESNRLGGALKEPVARKYFQQLICGLEYCHSKGVCHRDLKPENLMLDSEGNLRISDFGLSALNAGSSTSTQCGTANYVAPEVINHPSYDPVKADVWACGVILYTMLTAMMPFDHANVTELYKQIEMANYAWPSTPSVCSEAKQLAARILNPNPEARTTIAEIKMDKWFLLNFHDVQDGINYYMSKSRSPIVMQEGIEDPRATPDSQSSASTATLNAFTLMSKLDLMSLAPLVAEHEKHNVLGGLQYNQHLAPMTQHFLSLTDLPVLQEVVLSKMCEAGHACIQQIGKNAWLKPAGPRGTRVGFHVEFLHLMEQELAGRICGVHAVIFKPWNCDAAVDRDTFNETFRSIRRQIGPMHDKKLQEKQQYSPHGLSVRSSSVVSLKSMEQGYSPDHALLGGDSPSSSVHRMPGGNVTVQRTRRGSSNAHPGIASRRVSVDEEPASPLSKNDSSRHKGSSSSSRRNSQESISAFQPMGRRGSLPRAESRPGSPSEVMEV